MFTFHFNLSLSVPKFDESTLNDAMTIDQVECALACHSRCVHRSVPPTHIGNFICNSK